MTRDLALTLALALEFDRDLARVRDLAGVRIRGFARVHIRSFITLIVHDLYLEFELDRAFDLARDFDGVRDRVRGLDFDFDFDLARDLDSVGDRDKLRRTQFDVRDSLINYLKKFRPVVRSRSLANLQSLIDCLQLLNDRLEGKAQPVEAIALVRRERARK